MREVKTPGSDSMVHQPSSLLSSLLVEEVAIVRGESGAVGGY